MNRPPKAGCARSSGASMRGAASLGLAGLLSFALVGCGSAHPDEAIAVAASPIIKGSPSTSDQDAVVLLAIHGSGHLKGSCTGTLVAPNLVLTARHCVADTDHSALCSAKGEAIADGAVRSDYLAEDIYVYTGVSGIEEVTDTSRAAARGATIVHDSSPTLCNADVAFIVLDRSVQGTIATMRLKGGARVGEKLTAVGWGLTENGSMPSARMQRTDVVVNFIGPLVIDPNMELGLGDSEFIVGEAFCSGDSGGPSLSSKGAVVGVVSRGGGGVEDPGNPASSCVGGTVFNWYTHLAEKGALVEAAFAAAGAEPRLEGDPPGAPVGDTCQANVDCSSDACISGKCARRCDDGTKCSASEVCTAVKEKRVCAPPPVQKAAPPAPSSTETAAPTEAAPSPSVQNEMPRPDPPGCSVVTTRGGGSSGGTSNAALLGTLAGFAAVARRRRKG